MKLTPALAEEIRHRLDIVACEPDLLEDYGLTAPQVEALIATVPDRGEWTVPDWTSACSSQSRTGMTRLRPGRTSRTAGEYGRLSPQRPMSIGLAVPAMTQAPPSRACRPHLTLLMLDNVAHEKDPLRRQLRGGLGYHPRRRMR